MVDISNIVNISVSTTPTLAQFDNMNAVMIITSETGFLSSAKRYEIYKNLAAVANDFGTHSAFYQYAAGFFSTSPNPINADGYLIAGFWRAVNENVAASAATLVSGQVSEAAVVQTLQTISDGSFSITVDSTEADVTGLDFRTVTTLAGAAAIITANATFTALATATIFENSLIIKSKTTGDTSTLTLATTASAGTFIGDIFKISAGSGNTLTQGADASVLAAETKLAAITALRAEVFFAGAVFIDKPIDADVPALATWSIANDVILYDTFSGATYLDIAVSNPVWAVKLASGKTYRCSYSKAANRLLAVKSMARVHTTLFNGQNTAGTLNLKDLSMTPESYTSTEFFKAQEVGLDVYSTIKNTSVLLQSGANDYVDNVYNILALKNEIQVSVYNLLKDTSTKIPQTTAGVSQIVTSIEQVLQKFVRAGVIAPGVWQDSVPFGDLNTFKRAVSQTGYYVLAGLLSAQSEVDRAARKSPVIQAAIKFAGAIEHVDMIINIQY